MAKRKQNEIEEEVIYEEVEETEEIDELSDDFYSRNKNLINGVLGGIVLVVGGILLYNWWTTQQNNEANRDMYQAVYYYEADSFGKALNGDGQYLGFLDIVNDYSGTKAADVANYYIGIIYLSADSPQVSLGVDFLEQVSTSDNMLAMAKNNALAWAYEDLGDPEKAADYFERAASAPDDNDHTTPLMLKHAARNYEVAGRTDKALELYKRIKEEYPNSAESADVEKYIGILSK